MYFLSSLCQPSFRSPDKTDSLFGDHAQAASAFVANAAKAFLENEPPSAFMTG
jgi:hypothetical protein